MSDIDQWIREWLSDVYEVPALDRDLTIQEVEENPPKANPGYVYLFRAIWSPWLPDTEKTWRVKIGLSGNPEARLKRLNKEQAPCLIIKLYAVPVADMKAAEAQLHNTFAKYRLTFPKPSSSTEWFAIPKSKILEVKRQMDLLSVNRKREDNTVLLLLMGAILVALILNLIF